MIVDLLSVTDEPFRFEFTIKPDEIDLETEGVCVTGAIPVSGEVRRNAARIDVKGSLSAPLEIDCTRCLVPVRRELNITFNVDFVGNEMFPEGGETHVEEGDLDTDIIEGDKLDLTQLAREQIVLNLPETILCREDCRGICSKCGKDLNTGNCDCVEDEIDPRWAALKNLKS